MSSGTTWNVESTLKRRLMPCRLKGTRKTDGLMVSSGDGAWEIDSSPVGLPSTGETAVSKARHARYMPEDPAMGTADESCSGSVDAGSDTRMPNGIKASPVTTSKPGGGGMVGWAPPAAVAGPRYGLMIDALMRSGSVDGDGVMEGEMDALAVAVTVRETVALKLGVHDGDAVALVVIVTEGEGVTLPDAVTVVLGDMDIDGDDVAEVVTLTDAVSVTEVDRDADGDNDAEGEADGETVAVTDGDGNAGKAAPQESPTSAWR